MIMGWFGWRERTTRAVLVAGRAYDVPGATRSQVLALCEQIAAIAERAGAPIVAIPADVDLSDGAGNDDDWSLCSVYVGLLVAEGGTCEPLAVTREAMLAALKQAQSIAPALWEEIGAACEEAGGELADILDGTDITLRLCCTGSLPLARMVFGVLGKKGDELRGEYWCGRAPDRKQHATGVHGVSVQVCSVDTPALPIDLSDKAHAARVAKAPPKGGYYLIAEYD